MTRTRKGEAIYLKIICVLTLNRKKNLKKILERYNRFVEYRKSFKQIRKKSFELLRSSSATVQPVE